jgi:hypothetical protein
LNSGRADFGRPPRLGGERAMLAGDVVWHEPEDDSGTTAGRRAEGDEFAQAGRGTRV